MKAKGVLRSIGSATGPPLLVLVLWEIAARAHLLDVRFFPPPTAILQAAVAMAASGDLAQNLVPSLERLAAGFFMGAIPGIFLGAVMGYLKPVRAFFSPLVAALYPIPKIAILPLVLLVFGLGELSKYVIIAIAVFFITAMNTTAGVLGIDRVYWDVARNYRAGRATVLATVAIPGALPIIFTGIRLAVGAALLVLVAAEFVGTQTGLGQMIWSSWELFRVPRMYVAILMISLIGYVLSYVFDLIERKLIPWKG